MNDKSDISKYSCTPFQKIFRKTFVQHVTVWFVRIWTYKNADETSYIFSRRSRNVKKRTKNSWAYCVNPRLPPNHLTNKKKQKSKTKNFEAENMG